MQHRDNVSKNEMARLMRAVDVAPGTLSLNELNLVRKELLEAKQTMQSLAQSAETMWINDFSAKDSVAEAKAELRTYAKNPDAYQGNIYVEALRQKIGSATQFMGADQRAEFETTDPKLILRQYQGIQSHLATINKKMAVVTQQLQDKAAVSSQSTFTDQDKTPQAPAAEPKKKHWWNRFKR